MSHPAKDGAWITVTKVVRLECSKCGLVSVGTRPVNDRELDYLIREHVRKHGGRLV